MRPILTLCAALLLGAPSAFAQAPLTVSAAASLKDVLTALGNDFGRTHAGGAPKFNFAGSGTLRAQIEAGAPVDVFISADDKNMDALAAKNLIEPDTRHILAGNRLVLVAPSESKLRLKSFRDLARPEVARVGLGAPGVPAGDRAREVLARLGIEEAVNAKAVRGQDVREVLAQVVANNVDAGVVYKTDALAGPGVRIVATAPPSFHKPIRYPAALVRGGANRTLATQFLAFLSSKTARRAFKAAGFTAK